MKKNKICYIFLILLFSGMLHIPSAASENALNNEAQYDIADAGSNLKAAKKYFKQNEITLGLECLKDAADKTSDPKLLEEIKKTACSIKTVNIYDRSNTFEIIGIICLKQNKLQEAFDAYNRALELNPEDIELRYQLANLMNTSNVFADENALKIYNSILIENPEDTQIRATKANFLIKQGNLLSADKEFGAILELYPDSNQAKYGIYKIYENKLPPEKILLKMHEHEPSYKISQTEIKDFIKFLKEIDDDAAAQNFEEYLDKISKKSAPKKSQEKKEVVAQKPQTQKPQAQKPQTKKAQTPASQTQKIQTQKPQTSKTAEKDRAIYVETKDEKVQKEKELYQASIELQNAQNSSSYKKFQPAIDKYLKMTPKTADIYIAIANTYKLAGLPYNSLKYYREALKLDPVDCDTYFSIGLTYLELNKLESAKQHLTKSINLNPSNAKARNLLAFVNQKIITQIINNSYSKFENKQYIEAFEVLDRGIKKYPSCAQLYFYRAQIFAAMERNAAAIIDLQHAIELDPSYYMAYYELGGLYEKINNPKSALVAYERFLSTEPPNKTLVDEVQSRVIELGQKYY